MKKLKQTIKLNRKHPPQKIRTAAHGEVNKTFLIGIITFIALGSLWSLLLFTDVFVGKAISSSISGRGMADLTYDYGTHIFTFTADFPGEITNEIFFSLRSSTPGYYVCNSTTDIVITQGLGWEMAGVSAQDVVCEHDASSDNYVFSFGDAALWWENFSADRLQLQFQLAPPPNNFELQLDSFDLINSSGDNIFTGASGTFSFSAPVVVSTASSAAETGSSSSGGGGGTCNPTWQCSEWDLCNNTLQQSRKCVDVSRCKKDDKFEIQKCQPCEESWTCSVWTDCSNSVKTRSCLDEHYCRTMKNKPAESISCSASSLSSTRAGQQISSKGTPGTQLAKGASVQQPAPTAGGTVGETVVRVWQENKVYLMIIPIVLAMIFVLSMILYKTWHKPKKAQYNYDDLKEWILAEKKNGATEKEIRTILKEKTDWNDQDMDLILSEITLEDTSESNRDKKNGDKKDSPPVDSIKVDTAGLEWNEFDSLDEAEKVKKYK